MTTSTITLPIIQTPAVILTQPFPLFNHIIAIEVPTGQGPLAANVVLRIAEATGINHSAITIFPFAQTGTGEIIVVSEPDMPFVPLGDIVTISVTGDPTTLIKINDVNVPQTGSRNVPSLVDQIHSTLLFHFGVNSIIYVDGKRQLIMDQIIVATKQPMIFGLSLEALAILALLGIVIYEVVK